MAVTFESEFSVRHRRKSYRARRSALELASPHNAWPATHLRHSSYVFVAHAGKSQLALKSSEPALKPSLIAVEDQ
jgi:hypothetical protein